MKRNFLKFGLGLIAILAFSAGNAQQTTGDVGKTEDVGRSTALNGTIRVIDNKGTKKFLQVKNGLTLLTDATPDGGYVSTWQLGGALTDNTYIDVSGNVFGLDGLSLVTDITTASTDADADLNGSDHDDDASTGTTGWTVIIRDEDSGAFQKIKVEDLLQVQAGQLVATADTDGVAPTLSDTSIPTAFQKVSVYRNGVKLVANVDYTIPGAGGSVTLVPSTTAPNDWAILDGDVFEVHWVR